MNIDKQLELFDSQAPKGENWSFGIELETLLPSEFADSIDIGDYHCGEPVYEAPRFNGRRWLVEHDSSISSRSYNRQGAEFVSPVLVGNEGVENVLGFAEWLRSVGARVNNSCGVHIHIGIDSVLGRNASSATMVAFLTKVAHLSYRWQDALYCQTGTRRDRNHYCQRINDSSGWVMSVQSEQAKPMNDKCRHDTPLRQLPRYAPVNLQNMNGKGTIEFRAFAGTLNKNKLLHHLWSVFSIVHNAKRNLRQETYRWEQKSLRGSESLKWFYHHLGKNYFLPLFKSNFRSMRSKAERLAQQYDERI
tara:strand:- start:3103 stop:4017 length:915 start_codon:yes stop_codon:yes gene_type:complete